MHDQNLIKLLGIESLPDERKVAILDRASALVEQRLLLRLYKSLPEDKRNQLNDVLESSDKAKFNVFLIQEAPDFIKWVEEETLAVKDELKGLALEK